jgi:uncharacterized coiled-coil DUF342 family protein
MYNVNIDAIVSGYNDSFSIRVSALYRSIENGSYDSMDFNGSGGLYAVSNRKAQVCEMFATLPESIRIEVMTVTKGYAVAKVERLVQEYNIQKAAAQVAAPVVVEASEVEMLRAEVKSLQEKLANKNETIFKLKTRIITMVDAMDTLRSSTRTVVLGNVVTKIVEAIKLPV